MKKYHIVYRTHNLINGKEYTGKHSTDDLNDGYYGSSKILSDAIKKYGIENFVVEILSYHDSEIEAYIEEERIVDEEYVWRDDTYNHKIGGTGCLTGQAIYKDKAGNNHSLFLDDERIHTDEFVHINKNKIAVRDMEGNVFQTNKNDPRYLSGELVHTSKGKIHAITKTNEHVQIDINDPRLKSGELIPFSKGKVVVKDKNGNTMQVSVDDPRYLNGELVHKFKNMTTFKDEDGNIVHTNIDDPRVISGELVGSMRGTNHPGSRRGKISTKDLEGNFHLVSQDDPRFLSGELVGVNKGKSIALDYTITCEFCGKTGSPRGIKCHIRHCKLNPNRVPFVANQTKKSSIKICPNCNRELRARGYHKHIKTCKQII